MLTLLVIWHIAAASGDQVRCQQIREPPASPSEQNLHREIKSSRIRREKNQNSWEAPWGRPITFQYPAKYQSSIEEDVKNYILGDPRAAWSTEKSCLLDSRDTPPPLLLVSSALATTFYQKRPLGKTSGNVRQQSYTSTALQRSMFKCIEERETSFSNWNPTIYYELPQKGVMRDSTSDEQEYR